MSFLYALKVRRKSSVTPRTLIALEGRTLMSPKRTAKESLILVVLRIPGR